MRKTSVGCWTGRKLVVVAALPVMLGVAGCVAPSEALPPEHSRFEAAADAAASGGPAPCPGAALLADEQRLVQGGEGGGAFVLEAACPLLYDLDVRGLAGRLEVRLEGPDGLLLEEVANGVHADSVRVTTGGSSRGSVQEGASPPGTYRYAFAADRVADFRFQVRAA